MSAHGGSPLLRDRWAESVSRFPDAPAVRDDERTLTYAEFDALQRAIGTAVAARVPANGGVGVLVLGNGPVDGVPIVLLCGGGEDPLAFRPLVRSSAGSPVRGCGR